MPKPTLISGNNLKYNVLVVVKRAGTSLHALAHIYFATKVAGHLLTGERIKVSPHVLRHMFLRKLAEEKDVQYAKEASGHKSDLYIPNYVKPSQQNLAVAIDELDA